jgi:hypothetical protein
VLSTSPTFTTDITTPLINPSTFLNIGNAAVAGGALSKMRVGLGTGYVDLGERSSGLGAIWFTQSTPTNLNFSLGGSASGVTILNGGGSGGIDIRSLSSNILILKGADTSGNSIALNHTPLSVTSQTAGETNTTRWDGRGIQFTTGATIATQRTNYFRANTYTSTSATQTITDLYNLYSEVDTVSTNTTATYSWAAGFGGNVKLTASTSLLLVHATTATDFSTKLQFTNSSTGLASTDGTFMALANGVDFYFNQQESTGRVIWKVNSSDRMLLLPDGAVRLGGANTNGTTGAGSAFIIDANKNIICGDAALATTATNGFLYIPTCAGLPTGVPTTVTGRVPIVADSTNNRLYIYSGGAWVALN